MSDQELNWFGKVPHVTDELIWESCAQPKLASKKLREAYDAIAAHSELVGHLEFLLDVARERGYGDGSADGFESGREFASSDWD